MKNIKQHLTSLETSIENRINRLKTLNTSQIKEYLIDADDDELEFISYAVSEVRRGRQGIFG